MMLCLKDQRYLIDLKHFFFGVSISLMFHFVPYLKVKFDKFVEQGRILHNYASILELLLRLRQCCDHPFLVMR